ncbi:hypothetical protein [Spirulina sp. 06S082]|uniref:hypothetical protein n=1 Tax=Spirulina sp. 06S082 TaxID=3110248 RepID=UPI002B1F2D8C|nr:hypothetical protein [Spirulina sp. 06S082]MEA5468966.1 hypothetical protein [Spirulina sp. 06S082]
MPIRILLQTTLLKTEEDDWTIARFSILRDYLGSLKDSQGNPLCEITARDREPDRNGDDPILSNLDRDRFDQLWLFALDVGGGLSAKDSQGIIHFHQQGGGILSTRDHQDMGISMCALPEIGCYHYFHTQQQDPDDSRCCPDDTETTYISFPNYHSGCNGDYQEITAIAPIHELLQNPDTGETIKYFPSHPHEGGVGVPDRSTNYARVIATGKSKISGRSFNLVVAAESIQDEAGNKLGRVVAQSTFHHFVDYNFDCDRGCPSFVDEPPGVRLKNNPQALQDIQTYITNVALWLTPQ